MERIFSLCDLTSTIVVVMFSRIQSTVRRIPRGQVATYGQVAREAGYPGAARQVVWALRATSGLPWHRVVGAGGRVLLSGESALEQRFRLEAEGITFRGRRVRMDLHQVGWGKRKKKPSPRRSRRKAQRSSRFAT